MRKRGRTTRIRILHPRNNTPASRYAMMAATRAKIPYSSGKAA